MLMCSTSCALTENPAAYIWYKNREFLSEDWSPWYQELVSSEEAVTYSCAVKGYEDLRAPEVSVDSVTPTCFTVTYTRGRMCSYQQTSADESCSITYPREIHVQRTPTDVTGHIRLICNTSCLHSDTLASFMWFRNRQVDRDKEKQQISVLRTSVESFSCAVKGLEDLQSADVCVDEKNCYRVNYISRRICALKGSSLNISSEYSHPDNQQPESKIWYKVKENIEKEDQQLTGETRNVKVYDNARNQHILTLNNLKKKDSAEYIFRIKTNYEQVSGSPGVSLVVTDLKVKISPSPVVTEGERVSLTCRTSCPLPANTNYIWYFNNRPVNLTHNQRKHLLLDPVSSQDSGNYTCAVRTNRDINSALKTLTVQTKQTSKWNPAAAAVSTFLPILISLMVFLWIRKKRTSSRSAVNETLDNLEQFNCGPSDDDSSAQPAEQELYYSRIHFTKHNTDPIYSFANPPQSQDEEMVPYAVANFRSKSTSELNEAGDT
ncbi:B-cell receptor CD22-like [Mugil cephalus]|uniref:B-cell receptor CD22-like n=1 Tax=Mugil cephalus TaxID=48193 RepID=UPI001FB5DD80|nr:B-cell receptor CD22-like [Mugil cephalus]